MRVSRAMTVVALALPVSLTLIGCNADEPTRPTSADAPSEARKGTLAVKITPAVDTLAVGGMVALGAGITGATGKATPTWQSLSPAIAAVSATGEVRALAVGQARVVASYRWASDTATILVVGPTSGTPESGTPTTETPTTETPTQPTIARITVTLAAASVAVGQTTQATATAYDANGQPIGGTAFQWASSNTAVATVSGAGLVTAATAGTANITATASGITGGAAVQVTAPTTSTPTLEGTPIFPGEDIQAKVSAAAAGTKFVVKAGVHRRQQIVPKDGMVFQGEPGAILDGEGVTAYAIGTPSSVARNVIVKGLVIQGYAPPYDWAGAVGNDGALNWLIEGNEVRNNAMAGIRVGPGTRVASNKIHGNGVMGISAYKAHNAVIENNEVYDNAFTQDASAATATRAGMKIVGAENVVVRGNTVRNNGKHGIWFDIGCRNVLTERNTVVGNAQSGIWVEISYAAVVRYNHVERNGGSTAGSWLTRAGIQVSNSPDVEIYGNTVLDNANGITAMQASGYPADEGFGPLVVQNLYVHDNTVRMLVGNTGIAQNVGDATVFSGRNNRFVNNRYTLGANAGYFAWQDRFGLTESAWKGYGQDLTGTFTR